jgi:hypothetical protein
LPDLDSSHLIRFFHETAQSGADGRLLIARFSADTYTGNDRLDLHHQGVRRPRAAWGLLGGCGDKRLAARRGNGAAGGTCAYRTGADASARAPANDVRDDDGTRTTGAARAAASADDPGFGSAGTSDSNRGRGT